MPTDTFSVADDGTSYRESTVWANISSGTHTVGDTASIYVSQTKDVTPSYFLDNCYMRFDTSSIPDDATVTGANLLLYVVSKDDAADDFEYGADFYDFGGRPSVSGDWEATSSGDAISNIDPDALSISTVNTIALTGLGGINLSGYTGIRIAPLTSTQPSNPSLNAIEFAGIDHASQEPRLEVTYTLPAASIPIRSQHLDYDYSR